MVGMAVQQHCLRGGLWGATPLRTYSMLVCVLCLSGWLNVSKALGKFCPEYDVFAEFDLTLKWSGVVYLFESTDRHIGEFLPGVLPVVKHHAYSSQLWPVLKTTTKSRGSKPKGKVGELGDLVPQDPDESHVSSDGERSDGADDQDNGQGDVGLSDDLKLVLEMWDASILDAVHAASEAIPPPNPKPPPPTNAKPKPPGVAKPGLAPSEHASVASSKRGGGPKVRPRASAFIGGGRIDYYDSAQNFQATCLNPLHGQHCVLTRRGRLGKSSDIRDRRPLGMLALFLDSSSEHDSKASHMSIVPSLFSVDAHARRTLARTQLLLSEGGGDLASFERDIGPSEQEEPAQVR